MSCDYYEKYGSKFLSGELDVSEKNIFDLHSKTCTSCQEYLNAEKLVFSCLNSNLHKAPLKLNKKILDQLKLEKTKSVWLSRKAIYTLSIAATTVMLFLVNSLILTENDPLTDWQPETNLTSLNEISKIEDRIALLETDYRHLTTTTTSASEETDQIDQFEESITLIDAYENLY